MKANLTLANSNWTAGTLARSRSASRARDAVSARRRLEAVQPHGTSGGAAFSRWAESRQRRSTSALIRILAQGPRHRIPDLTLTIVGTWDRHVRRYYEKPATPGSGRRDRGLSFGRTFRATR